MSGIAGYSRKNGVYGLILLLLSAGTMGCASPTVRMEPAQGTTQERTAADFDADLPTLDDLLSPDEPYRLRIGDEIRLEVFREREISGTFRLTQPEGAIRHPLLGDVALKGMTLGAAETYIRQQLAEDYLVNPRVILQLAHEPEPPRDPEEADLQVLVMGQVRNPGAVTFSRGERLTLLEAISLAGGFTDGASRNRVRLVRETDGKRESIRVRVDDILSGRQGHHNIELKSGDTISVPEVWF